MVTRTGNNAFSCTFTQTSAWQEFFELNNLSDKQRAQFEQYARLLISWNERHNLTTITDNQKIIADHFQDSVMLSHAVDLSQSQGIVDVGSGGGFPGIPLAIMTNTPIYLVEVVQKKLAFLELVQQELDLTHVQVIDYDWRTFLRMTDYPVSYVCARASLQPKQLLRMFKPASPYKKAMLVYWASNKWEAGPHEQSYVDHEYRYSINEKHRRLVFMRPQ